MYPYRCSLMEDALQLAGSLAMRHGIVSVSWQSVLQQNSSLRGSTYANSGPRKSIPRITSYASVFAMMTGAVIVVCTLVPLARVKVSLCLVLPRHVSVAPPAVSKVSPKISSGLQRLICSLKELPSMIDDAPLSITALQGRFPSISNSLPPVTSVAIEYRFEVFV